MKQKHQNQINKNKTDLNESEHRANPKKPEHNRIKGNRTEENRMIQKKNK